MKDCLGIFVWVGYPREIKGCYAINDYMDEKDYLTIYQHIDNIIEEFSLPKENIVRINVMPINPDNEGWMYQDDGWDKPDDIKDEDFIEFSHIPRTTTEFDDKELPF